MYHKLIYEERQKKYHDWFLIHSGMQKKINLKESQEEKEIGMNLDEKWSYISLDNNNVPDIDKIKSQTYEEWFSRHCVKGIDDRILMHNDNMSILPKTDFHDNAACYQNNEIKEEDFFSFYTSICKKFYPLILGTNSKIYDKICNNNFKKNSFYCFTCDNHFCINCKNNHIKHSFINFEQITIHEEEIIKIEKLVKKKYLYYLMKN